MDTNLEIEFKTMLTKEQYELLKSEVFTDEGAIQTNVYYDNQNRELLAKGIMMRIRHIEGKPDDLTLKEAHEDGVMEHTYLSDKIDINSEEITQMLVDLDVQGPFSPIAHSVTHRTKIIDEFGEWALDHSQFENGEDFELEYELFKNDPLAEKRYLDLLNRYHIEYKQSSPKFIRALNSQVA